MTIYTVIDNKYAVNGTASVYIDLNSTYVRRVLGRIALKNYTVIAKVKSIHKRKGFMIAPAFPAR